MTSSTIGVFNLALAFLGGEQLSNIQAPWEDSALGRLCLNLWPFVLDEALSAHPWSFALARAALAEKPEPTAEAGYPFRYALPADCLRPVGLAGPYVLEGRDLLSAAPRAELLYVRRVDDPALWPPAFKVALAWGLAVVLASARLNDSPKQKHCLERYNLALREAMARDNNMRPPVPKASPWELARGGSCLA